MAVRRASIRFACGDNYALAFSEGYIEVVEGTFMPDTFGATYTQGEGTPFSSPGIPLAVGQPLNAGPRTVPGAGIRLDKIYFRNTTAGSNAFVNFNGIVEDVFG